MEWTDWARALFALVATVALIGLAAWGLRRFGMLQGAEPGKPRRMKVEERLMLDPRRQLVIVRVDGAEHLLILSPFGDRPIAALTPAASEAPKDA
jgi:flagellar protein FliO/FliZ